MFNRRDLIPKVPKAGVGSMSKWRRVGRKGNKKQIVLCGNSSSMIPPLLELTIKEIFKNAVMKKELLMRDVFSLELLPVITFLFILLIF